MEKQERVRPLISISGVAFVVDVHSEEFVDYAEPCNRISFDQLLQRGTGYVLLFNPLNSTAWTGSAISFPDHVIITHIPPIVKLDPEGLSRKILRPLPELLNSEDDTEWLTLTQVESTLRSVRKWRGR